MTKKKKIFIKIIIKKKEKKKNNKKKKKCHKYSNNSLRFISYKTKKHSSFP